MRGRATRAVVAASILHVPSCGLCMTLRIFEDSDRHGPIVALHGRLGGDTVAEFEKVAAAHGQGLRVDLSHLTGTDADGLQALVRIRAAGARLVGASPFTELLLERTVDAGATGAGKRAK
jgi:anti-anti-sigma regulatory factor